MTILGIHNPDPHRIVLIPLCHIDGLPCPPEVKQGDQKRCRCWWGGQAVHDKCEARKREMAEKQ